MDARFDGTSQIKSMQLSIQIDEIEIRLIKTKCIHLISESITNLNMEDINIQL